MDVDADLLAAARLVIETQFGSAPMLQRKLGIGFGAAGGLMDQLEREGVVGGQQHPGRARDVLVDLGRADEVCARIGARAT